MQINRPSVFILFLILIALSVACSLSGTETKPELSPEASSQDTISTAVAATLAAGAVEDPAPTAYSTVHPTVTASPPEPNFNYAGVSFYFNDLLADNITAGITPSNYSAEASWWSTPEHREFLFNNWILADAFHKPAIRIYPVAEFKALNENIGVRLDSLKGALAAQSSDMAAMDVPDMFGAGQLFQSNIRFLDFQNGSGARWLSQYGQAYFPIGFPSLFYTFQGFTTDGQDYISVVLPVNHPSLPNTMDITMDDDFYNNIDSYTAGIRNQLDGQADSSFVPSLVLLDEMVQSLLVGNP